MLYRLSYMGKNPKTTGSAPPAFITTVCAPTIRGGARILERVMGIEPTSSAWKAEVLPLNYTRLTQSFTTVNRRPVVWRLHQKIMWWREEDSLRSSILLGAFSPEPSGPPRIARRSKSLQAIS